MSRRNLLDDGPSAGESTGERGETRDVEPAETAGGLDRRGYLQILGAAGLLGFGASSSSVASATADSDARTVEVTDEDETDWEAAADERIREHRTADLTVEVVDDDGNPVAADVNVEMNEHAYGFGTAVNAGTLIEETEPGDDYREHIPELFNKAVLENHHKWRFWEESTELSDEATQWILDHALDLRGHVALWGNVEAWAVPPDVVKAMGVEWEDNGVTDPELDPEYVYERTTEHVREIIEHYGDDIEEWEIYNEAIHQTRIVEAIEGGEIPDGAEYNAWTAPIVSEWYDIAADVAPDGVTLATNDYNVFAGPYESERKRYREQIEALQDDGVDLGSVGLQSHFGEDETLTSVEMLEGLNEYAQYGAELKVTEFDTADDSWDDEAKADYLYRFLKTLYSHPATSDFLMWGFWDGRHWQGEAPLFYEDWSKKPAYDAYTELVFDQWWTDTSGTTDDGTFSARAYLGYYDLTLSVDEGELEIDAAVTDPSPETVHVQTVEIDVLGGGNGRSNGNVPVRVSDGDAFEADDLDTDTVRFGAPDAVNDGGGSPVQNERNRGGGNGDGRDHRVLVFDAEESALDGGAAMLRGETDDGTVVVGYDG
ncbi:endo-1,4-beta-xylanase [Halopelagius fulvigenes]|uniref:endo-1,4-beta-xylanase n=1 Tax=Halopelagius fulvigenes TaxID=1198324 RepID=A0ABD5TXX3_9EURY